MVSDLVLDESTLVGVECVESISPSVGHRLGVDVARCMLRCCSGILLSTREHVGADRGFLREKSTPMTRLWTRRSPKRPLHQNKFDNLPICMNSAPRATSPRLCPRPSHEHVSSWARRGVSGARNEFDGNSLYHKFGKAASRASSLLQHCLGSLAFAQAGRPPWPSRHRSVRRWQRRCRRRRWLSSTPRSGAARAAPSSGEHFAAICAPRREVWPAKCRAALTALLSALWPTYNLSC